MTFMSTARQHYDRPFRSGESVPLSGLYRGEHEVAGCDGLEFVLIAGDQFPHCPECGGEARFTLVHGVPYIFEDPDFFQR